MRIHVLKDERGVALITVIGIMMIVTMLAFGIIIVSETDITLTQRDKESMEALHVAEAGIHKALWQLEKFGSAMDPKTFTMSVGDGTVDVNAYQDASSAWYWTIESTGTVGMASRKLKVTVFNFSLWDMNMGLGEADSMASGGNGIVGTTSVDGPFYVRGNVQLSGNSELTGGPLFIKTGTLRFMDSGSTLGYPDDLVTAYIEPAEGNEDILDKHGNPLEPGDSQVNVSTLSNQVPDIKLPPLESLTDYRERAASESEEVCSAYPGIITAQSQLSGYKVLDNDLSISTDPETTYHIDSSVSSFGLEVGEFAWDNENNRLYVNGTVFVDGNLVIGDSENSEINYYGNGTIVVNGDIKIKGKFRPPIGGGNYSMDATHVIGLVTPEEIEIDVSSGNPSPSRDVPDVAGAFFAAEEIEIESNNTSFVGSMIAGVLDFGESANNSHLFTFPSLSSILPPSLPGSDGFLAMTASWREVD